MQLFVNEERFRLDKGHLLAYQRTLSMKHGILHRIISWESTTGIRLRITIERFASLADVHVGCIRYQVTADHSQNDLAIELLASFNTAVGNYDLMHWETVEQDHQENLLWLKSITRSTGVELAQTMSFLRHRFWQDADILIEGDDTAQRGIRYSIYQLRMNAPLHDPRYSIAAKGLTGFGYRGHIFHDTEVFMVPFFAYMLPDVARNLLMYRYATLPAARGKAQQNGYEGAQYAWESTLSGLEMTPLAIVHPEIREIIPVLCGELEIHISASIAFAAWRYWVVSGDDAFLRDYGAEMILSTALFWGSRAEKHPKRNRYEITNVIGPDEWHEHVNNNAFTNAMARWNLQTALATLNWLQRDAPEKARALEQQLDLTKQRLDSWQDIIRRIEIPQDQKSGLIEQFDGFFQLEPLDQEKYKGRTASYQAIFGTKEIQKYRILKQADVLMLLALLGREFDLKTKSVNWDYYYPLTDHDYGSSLSPALHVILACELGKGHEAYDLFLKGSLIDLENLRGNTPDGIHLACCGGVWQAVIFGFAGLRITDAGYTTESRLPATWTRLTFSFLYKGRREFVDIRR